MTWITDPQGCSKCNHCGMDMDMEPYCVQKDVLASCTKETGKQYPYGLDINPAWIVCTGTYFDPRKQ